ncbi:MAG: hypothetical protein BWZ02_03052 [Lentisphaerae bacterium ADurb.BinA184]|nr:MAG: hypothetical protein BWZ02_03052 [Lentisphaerae bacterium ADurb.BinA184]
MPWACAAATRLRVPETEWLYCVCPLKKSSVSGVKSPKSQGAQKKHSKLVKPCSRHSATRRAATAASL